MSDTSSIGLFKIIILVAGMGYLLLALFALLFANRLIFPAPPPGYQDSPETRKFTYNEQGDAVTLQYLPHHGSKFLIFYHHGNGEDLHSIQARIGALHQLGFSVLAWDYPGYGTSDGKPSTRIVLEISELIWSSIPDAFGYSPEQVVLYGYSVGSGPATWLASRHRAAGLVLEGAFTSIFRVGLPFNPLPWDPFDNLSRINAIQVPVLFLHGTKDETIPFNHGRKLYEKASEPKYFAWFEGGGHTDLLSSYTDIYMSSVLQFSESLKNGNK